MEGFLLVLFMIIIGALIGGVTNHLAIKMLFHPYKAIYIGGKRVPFTPGLIPKRRDELAKQMGKLVVEHLLTPDSIKKKLQDESFVKGLENWAIEETENLIATEKSISQVSQQFGIHNIDIKTEEKFLSFIDKKYENIMQQIRTKQIENVIPPVLLEKIDTKIPEAADYIIAKGIDYFESEEGRSRLRRMLDDFLATRGMLGNMVQMFLGNSSLVDKIQPEIIKFLNNPGTKELLVSLIEKEWVKVKAWEVGKLEELVGSEKMMNTIKEQAIKLFPVKSYFEISVQDLVNPYKEMIVHQFVPKAVAIVGDLIANRVESMMERLHLADIVRNQVETFSVERLEDMVLSISKREFKMITYLGALLGGIIGIFQGIISLIMN